MDVIAIFAHQSTINKPQWQSENMFLEMSAPFLNIKNWSLVYKNINLKLNWKHNKVCKKTKGSEFFMNPLCSLYKSSYIIQLQFEKNANYLIALL